MKQTKQLLRAVAYSGFAKQSRSVAWVKASPDTHSLCPVLTQQRAAVRERNFREALELLRAVDALSLAEAAAHQRAHQLRAGQALEARGTLSLTIT